MDIRPHQPVPDRRELHDQNGHDDDQQERWSDHSSVARHCSRSHSGDRTADLLPELARQWLAGHAYKRRSQRTPQRPQGLVGVHRGVLGGKEAVNVDRTTQHQPHRILHKHFSKCVFTLMSPKGRKVNCFCKDYPCCRDNPCNI